MSEDILLKLADLHKQATTERSHYYVAACVRESIAEITRLRASIAMKDKALDEISAGYMSPPCTVAEGTGGNQSWSRRIQPRPSNTRGELH